MRFFKKHLLVLIAIPPMISVHAQFTDTSATRLPASSNISAENKWDLVATKRTAGYKAFIVPGILIAYGASSLASNSLKNFNAEMKKEIWQEHPHSKTSIDDFLRYSPVLAVYGLN